ncbi:unnamed protein product [Heterosigma akashiwo]
MKFLQNILAGVLLFATLAGAQDNLCSNFGDENTCRSSSAGNEQCVWCSCSAVPSGCYQESLAHKLPAAVFSCAFTDMPVGSLRSSAASTSSDSSTDSDSEEASVSSSSSSSDSNSDDARMNRIFRLVDSFLDYVFGGDSSSDSSSSSSSDDENDLCLKGSEACTRNSECCSGKCSKKFTGDSTDKKCIPSDSSSSDSSSDSSSSDSSSSDSPSSSSDEEEETSETLAHKDHYHSVAMTLFEPWATEHAKEYANEEERAHRFGIFHQTVKEVLEHNQSPGARFRMGLNRFADLSWEEFRAGWLMDAQEDCSATAGARAKGPLAGKALPHDLPLAVDWREKGAVSHVKDQGSCGSCWTFSTTGALEAHYYLAAGEMPDLSEQQLVDCAGAFDNHGCNGGLPSHAFEYIKHQGGLDSEAAYPYVAKTGSSCEFDPSGVAAMDFGSVNITFQDEAELHHAVAPGRPVSVAFQVASDFKSYASGQKRQRRLQGRARGREPRRPRRGVWNG